MLESLLIYVTKQKPIFWRKKSSKRSLARPVIYIFLISYVILLFLFSFRVFASFTALFLEILRLKVLVFSSETWSQIIVMEEM